jgi:ABC-type Zn uptake system ZnuABC Zn-binding protein ZnuA
MLPHLRRRDALAALAALGTAACAHTAAAQKAPAPARPGLIATTTTLASLAGAVAGADADVSTLVPLGASPETYEPTPGDIARLRSAQVLVANGAGLESWLDHTIAAAASPSLVRVVCAQGLPVVNGNPHLWMDPEFARMYVRKIRDALAAAAPVHAAAFGRRAAAYDAKLVALARRIRTAIATIPPANRNLIVFQDAWSYYARRFGLHLLGVIESSPGREPNPAELAALVALARSRRVRAAFAEPEYNPKLMHTLAQAAGIETIAVLYDDSLGTDPHIHDYIAMLDYDTATIVSALR